MAYDPEHVLRAQTSDTWSAIARTGADVASLAGWDADLLREPRVLVPVDVQALVVGPGDAEPVVTLLSPLSPGAAEDATSSTARSRAAPPGCAHAGGSSTPRPPTSATCQPASPARPSSCRRPAPCHRPSSPAPPAAR